MKEQKKGKCKIPNSKGNMQSSGVTLIALIITIIILLILAVTSVVLVMRWNIIEKTEYAAEGYQGASEKESIELAYEEWALNDDENANLNMEGQADVTGNGGKSGWNVEFKNSGHEYTVDGNGNISRRTGPLEEAVVNDDYGKKVKFKSKGKGLEDLIWRIFYEDSKNVYLISEKQGENGEKEYPITNLTLKDHILNYPNGASVSTQGQDLMPKAKEDGTVFSTDNENDNIRATAYLCDITQWEDYLDAEGKAAWAMGAPTFELFVKSYDATKDGDPKEETQLEIIDKDSKGYNNPLSDGKFDKTKKNGIYRLKDSCNWWLASPSYISKDFLRIVRDSSSGGFVGRRRRGHQPRDSSGGLYSHV